MSRFNSPVRKCQESENVHQSGSSSGREAQRVVFPRKTLYSKKEEADRHAYRQTFATTTTTTTTTTTVVLWPAAANIQGLVPLGKTNWVGGNLLPALQFHPSRLLARLTPRYPDPKFKLQAEQGLTKADRSRQVQVQLQHF